MSFREVQIGPCRLINGPSENVLRTITQKFGLVATDPPYGNNYSTGRRSGIYRPSTRITGDILSEPLLNDVAEQLEPLLNDVAAVYWFAAPDRLDMVLPILKRWSVVNVLAWDKGNCTAGDLECSYGKQWESIVFAVTQKHELVGGRDRDVLRFSRGSTADYVHPTQKPVDLMEYLIGRHSAEWVIDPFMGRGTTGIAAISHERKFVGIEKDPQYFDVACEQIQRAWDLKCSELPFEKEPPARQLSLIE